MSKTYTDEQWQAAYDRLIELMAMYAEIPTGGFGLMMMQPLKGRYLSGERTAELYKEMMECR